MEVYFCSQERRECTSGMSMRQRRSCAAMDAQIKKLSTRERECMPSASNASSIPSDRHRRYFFITSVLFTFSRYLSNIIMCLCQLMVLHFLPLPYILRIHLGILCNLISIRPQLNHYWSSLLELPESISFNLFRNYAFRRLTI